MIADLSVNHFERHALLCGFSVERVRNDYGYDLFMFIYNEAGEIENGDVRVQMKATDTLPVCRADGTFPFRLDRSDLILWLNEIMPVVLVVYDAQNEVGYWLDVQYYFAQQESFSLFEAGRTVSASIPVTNLVNQAAVRSIANLRWDEHRQRRRT